MHTDTTTASTSATALLGLGGFLLVLGVLATQLEAGSWLVGGAMAAAAVASVGSVVLRRRQAEPVAVEQAPIER
ncbi:hypothetical protein [Cellulomonas pakistanensis]|uniref:Uncharacterized protein n=1 Tax=Cellulomonas pakistanensis TaxID=992287 RepID=A0A919PAA6_9CELL|nr:hypothetical protein [Cellulomonas pakistanensis]GIG35926.1 hypothetical protein Cpa01nite_13070 [Cellulomonas pakistanensis]